MTTVVKSVRSSRNQQMPHPAISSPSFISRFFVALTAFAAVNFVVLSLTGPTSMRLTRETLAQQTDLYPLYHSWTWWMAKAFLDQQKAPDVVLIGSSQINHPAHTADAKLLNRPIDAVLHRQSFALEKALESAGLGHQNVINCAMDGAMASDYWMITRSLFTEQSRPKLLILGISPRDFIDNKLPSASATEPFRFFSRYVDRGKLNSIAYHEPLARFTADAERTFDALPTRGLHNTVESLLTGTGGKKFEAEEVVGVVRGKRVKVKPGEYIVPVKTEGFWIDNSHEYTNRYKNTSPPCYPGQITFFKEFLGMMRDQNVQVLVVGMPTLAQNRILLSAKFWQSFRTEMASICRDHNASFIDISASSEFEPTDFVDTVHLNSKGGEKLFAVMARQVSSETRLAKALSANSNAGLAYTSKSKPIQ